MQGLVYNLTSIGCVVSAAYMLMHDKTGWGWFLFVAYCCHTTEGKD